MHIIFMPPIEQRLGTAKFLVRYFLLSRCLKWALGLIYHLLFLAIAWAVFDYHIYYDCGIYFASAIELVVYCFKYPNQINRYLVLSYLLRCCFAIPMPAIIIPFVFMALDAYQLGAFPIHWLVYMFLALLEWKGFLRWLIVPNSFAQCLDSTIFCAFSMSKCKYQ